MLDVDDTTLTTWNYELYSNWDFNPTTNANSSASTGHPPTFTGNMFPATPGMVDLVSQAKAWDMRSSASPGAATRSTATIANLVNDTAAGFSDITTVTLSGKTVPEIDAGYVTPTPIGHRPRRIHRRPVHQAAGRLVPGVPRTRPSSARPRSPPRRRAPTIQYKSGTRAYIESQGYDIVANFGDQFSDLEGGFADKTFKMPNPNYYLP